MAKPTLSDAIQDYLKAIYHLQHDGDRVSVTALAREQKVAAASASGMVKKLAALGLVEHAPYRGVRLTRAGEKVAVEVIRHHRLLELYLAKTLILKTAEGYLRAVVPASCRLDERKVRDVTGGNKKDVHLAAEDDLRRDYPDFELGAVPPIGGSRRDPVIVDSRVKTRESVVLEAGSHEQSVRLAPADLVRAANARVADLCQD